MLIQIVQTNLFQRLEILFEALCLFIETVKLVQALNMMSYLFPCKNSIQVFSRKICSIGKHLLICQLFGKLDRLIEQKLIKFDISLTDKMSSNVIKILLYQRSQLFKLQILLKIEVGFDERYEMATILPFDMLNQRIKLAKLTDIDCHCFLIIFTNGSDDNKLVMRAGLFDRLYLHYQLAQILVSFLDVIYVNIGLWLYSVSHSLFDVQMCIYVINCELDLYFNLVMQKAPKSEFMINQDNYRNKICET